MKEIETNRCILRKVEKSDSEFIFKILSNSEIIKNLNMPIHESIEDTEKMLEKYFQEYEKGNYYPYAIIDKFTNSFVGVFLIKLDLYDEDCFEFTIYLNKEWWGKGIYTEVLPYMTTVAFEKIKTGNFRGFVKEKNDASSRVLEKCNFKLEKIFEVPGIKERIKSYLITKEEYELRKMNNVL